MLLFNTNSTLQKNFDSGEKINFVEKREIWLGGFRQKRRRWTFVRVFLQDLDRIISHYSVVEIGCIYGFKFPIMWKLVMHADVKRVALWCIQQLIFGASNIMSTTWHWMHRPKTILPFVGRSYVTVPVSGSFAKKDTPIWERRRFPRKQCRRVQKSVPWSSAGEAPTAGRGRRTSGRVASVTEIGAR